MKLKRESQPSVKVRLKDQVSETETGSVDKVWEKRKEFISYRREGRYESPFKVFVILG